MGTCRGDVLSPLTRVLAELERRLDRARAESDGQDLLEPLHASNAAIAEELEELQTFVLCMIGEEDAAAEPDRGYVPIDARLLDDRAAAARRLTRRIHATQEAELRRKGWRFEQGEWAPPTNEPLVSSVEIETKGNHSLVKVWIRHQSVGALLCAKEDAEALRNLLLLEHAAAGRRLFHPALDRVRHLLWVLRGASEKVKAEGFDRIDHLLTGEPMRNELVRDATDDEMRGALEAYDATKRAGEGD
jgi:hypothetical protein